MNIEELLDLYNGNPYKNIRIYNLTRQELSFQGNLYEVKASRWIEYSVEFFDITDKGELEISISVY